MKISEVLIKPVLSEKATNLQESKVVKYSFKVNRKANKHQIKQAIETFYNVKVAEVNTMNTPSKSKSRMTKTIVLKGFKPNYKKAIVTLQENHTINLFNEI